MSTVVACNEKNSEERERMVNFGAKIINLPSKYVGK